MSRAFAGKARVPAPRRGREQRVSTPGDRHEREADLAAGAMLRGDHAFSLSQLGGEDGNPVQREGAPGAGSLTAPASNHAGGASLDAGTRSAMEARLINPRWAAYLESLRYGVQLFPNANGIGFSRVLMRTLVPVNGPASAVWTAVETPRCGAARRSPAITGRMRLISGRTSRRSELHLSWKAPR